MHNDVLHEFSAETGVYVRRIAPPPKTISDFFPNFLITDSENTIYVVDRGNKMIWRIVDDKFIPIGSKGSKKGQFNEPTTVALLSPWKLVVCDHGNNRLQIFKFVESNMQ